MFFGSKQKLKKAGILNVVYNRTEIKHYSRVACLGCLRHEISGKSISLKTISKVNLKLKFIYRKSKFLTLKFRRSFLKALQSYCDYDFSAWYANLTQKLKNVKLYKINESVFDFNWIEYPLFLTKNLKI